MTLAKDETDLPYFFLLSARWFPKREWSKIARLSPMVGVDENQHSGQQLYAHFPARYATYVSLDVKCLRRCHSLSNGSYQSYVGG